MAGASTKEYCRVCGDVTLHKEVKREGGMVVWRVICPKCKGEEGGIKYEGRE